MGASLSLYARHTPGSQSERRLVGGGAEGKGGWCMSPPLACGPSWWSLSWKRLLASEMRGPTGSKKQQEDLGARAPISIRHTGCVFTFLLVLKRGYRECLVFFLLFFLPFLLSWVRDTKPTGKRRGRRRGEEAKRERGCQVTSA